MCGCVPEFFGSTNDNKNAIASKIKVLILPEDPKSRDPKDPKVEKLKYFTKIPQQLKFSKDKKFDYNIDDEGFYKLLTIPRFYLKALSNEIPPEELVNYQPMKPELKIRVKIYVRNYDNNEYIRSAALFLKAMLVTMKYLGIGSASNRGFGRFKLESIVKFNPKLKDYIIKGFSKECLNMCKESCKNSESSSFPIFPEAEKIKFNVSSEINNVTIDTYIDPKDIKLIRFVKPVNSRRVKIKNFNCYNVEAKDIEGVLAAIGLATLKLTWKSERMCKEKRIIGGRGYHTWPLGLPRSKSKKK
ncbi:MAG: RAMP superfamily CRISPR-associated protein [Caldisphaera sp.]